MKMPLIALYSICLIIGGLGIAGFVELLKPKQCTVEPSKNESPMIRLDPILSENMKFTELNREFMKAASKVSSLLTKRGKPLGQPISRKHDEEWEALTKQLEAACKVRDSLNLEMKLSHERTKMLINSVKK